MTLKKVKKVSDREAKAVYNNNVNDRAQAS